MGTRPEKRRVRRGGKEFEQTFHVNDGADDNSVVRGDSARSSQALAFDADRAITPDNDPLQSISPTEQEAAGELVKLMREAHGNHPSLAKVRRQIAARMDSLTNTWAAFGVDPDLSLIHI